MSEEIRLQARGLTIAGLRWGRGAGCRVLCTHGWLDNAATFTRLAPLLAGCDVVAIDLPGHGHSAHRGAGSMQHFVEYIADVNAALDALQWESAVLLGHSLGAGVMACSAGVFVQRASALVLIEGIAPQPAPDEKILESLRAAAEAGQRGAGESAGYDSMAAAIAARRKGFWPMSDEASALILARALTAGADGTLRWHTDARLRQPSALRLSAGQVRAMLNAVRAPALLVGATSGLFATHAAHAERIADITTLQHVVLHGGHHLHLEADSVDCVAGSINGFLRQHALV
jgi:pimeloyl-ACP methyl ester carboxylesterase